MQNDTFFNIISTQNDHFIYYCLLNLNLNYLTRCHQGDGGQRPVNHSCYVAMKHNQPFLRWQIDLGKSHYGQEQDILHMLGTWANKHIILNSRKMKVIAWRQGARKGWWRGWLWRELAEVIWDGEMTKKRGHGEERRQGESRGKEERGWCEQKSD